MAIAQVQKHYVDSERTLSIAPAPTDSYAADLPRIRALPGTIQVCWAAPRRDDQPGSQRRSAPCSHRPRHRAVAQRPDPAANLSPPDRKPAANGAGGGCIGPAARNAASNPAIAVGCKTDDRCRLHQPITLWSPLAWPKDSDDLADEHRNVGEQRLTRQVLEIA